MEPSESKLTDQITEKEINSIINSENKNFFTVRTDRVIKNIILLCIGIEILLVFLDLIFSHGRLIPMDKVQEFFNLDSEKSSITFFCTVQTFFAGLTLLFIYFFFKSEKVKGLKLNGWLILSLFFIYMSFDDCSFFHEGMGSLFSFLMKEGHLPAFITEPLRHFPSYYWHIVLGPFFVSMGIFMLIFLWNNLKDIKLKLYLLFSIMCLANAVLLDFLEPIDPVVWKFAVFFNISNEDTVHFFRLIEEYLEMLAITVLFYIFLKHLSNLMEKRGILFRKF